MGAAGCLTLGPIEARPTAAVNVGRRPARVTGRIDGRATGYAELTGYAETNCLRSGRMCVLLAKEAP